MKKLNTLALLVTSATIALSAGSALAQSNEDNWLGVDGTTWRTGDGTLCWRDAFWTPATANPNCDGALKPEVVPPKPQGGERPTVGGEKVVYSADALFDFDKAVLKPAGKADLTELARRIHALDALEVVVATGHTDSTGPEEYNMRLSVRRAEAVKAFLVSQGVPAERIYIEGKGETQPIATNSTRAGRALNRRVEVEVIGTRKAAR